MRILHVVDYFHTDVGYQEYYLAKAQAADGHRVRVLTSAFRHHSVGEAGPDEVAGAQELDRAGAEVVRLPARQLGHDRAWLHGLSAAVGAFAPDVVHCHTAFGPTTVRTARAASRLGVPVLVDNHIQERGAPAASRPSAQIVYRAYRVLFGRFLARSVGDWVTDGPDEAAFLSRRLGLDRHRVSIVTHGFDPSVFFFDEEARRAERQRRRWGDDLVVAVTGKLYPAKRVEWAARAAESVAEPGTRLVLAGSVAPDYLAEVRRAAPSLARAGRLEVHPMLARRGLADLYLGADVVVFPRLPSISIFEAAGTGVPVLLADDEFGDLLHERHPGVRIASPERLAEELGREPDRAAQARRAREVFSWPVISEEFVRRYQAMR